MPTRTLIALFLGCLMVVAAAYAAESASDAPWRTLGDKAPELNVDFVKGEPITIAQDPGTQVFVVEFWATWCGPCRFTAPRLSALQKKYAAQGLVVIGVTDEDAETVKPFLEKEGHDMEYRVALDRARTTNGRYFEGFGRENTLPTAYVIDGNGRVAWIGNPANPFMDKLIENLVAGLPRIAEEAAQPARSDPPTAAAQQ
jgi:thiol-disulfide isomerase/thioredoxin